MPQEATHIKFALDLKEKYKINNLASYISGTIYPDSRYITKIDRELTHGGEETISKRTDRDFKKGWEAHLLCDKICDQVIEETLPELFVDAGPGGQGTERWIIKSAIKAVQDIAICKKFNPNPYLAMVDYPESPNGESLKNLAIYNQLIRGMYEKKKELGVEDIKKMWLNFGLDRKTVKKVGEKTSQLLSDANTVKKIISLYQKMVAVIE